jgi:hypothetical protein
LRAQAIVLSLLQGHPLQLVSHFWIQHQICHARGRIRDRQKSHEIAARLRHRDRGVSSLAPALGVLTQIVNEITEILRKVRLTATRGSRCDLKCDRVKARVVALGVALYERLDLIRVRHRNSTARL